VFYYLVFGALAAIVAALELAKSGKDRVATSPAFNSFKNNYILVYSLMMCTPPDSCLVPSLALPRIPVASRHCRPPDLDWGRNAGGIWWSGL
jgi:hypothetical protein